MSAASPAHGAVTNGRWFPGRPIEQAVGWVTLITAAAAAAGSAWLLPSVAGGATHRIAVPWVPELGIMLSFQFDGLSLLFTLLIGLVGVFVTLYAGRYLAGYEQTGRFFLYLLAFMVSMLGLVTADNLIVLFVFWELTSVTSFLLIGYQHENETARRNALQALLVTAAGGLAMLAGLLLLASVGGSMELSELTKSGDTVRDHPLYEAILVLILIGAFTKSAQVPFHFWLPNAMAAPTPVSAYLHSATMVKGGIYLMARIHPTMAGTPEWIWTLTIVGSVTAVWASIVALRQTDLKLSLAYTTVMALGTLTMFLGSEARVAIAAAVTFLLVHSLYKCALFLVVGIIDHETGTRDADRLGGLWRALPVTALAAAAAAFSMAGFPPFLGFIGKELKYEGALAVASEPWFVASAAVAANAMMVAVAGVVGVRPFFARPGTAPVPSHEAPMQMWIGPLCLGMLGLVLGLVPPFVGAGLVQPAVQAILGAPEAVKLALWHGINIPLLMSVLTVALGLVLLGYQRTVRDGLGRWMARLPFTGDRAYDRFMAGLAWVATVQTRILQHGSLRGYLAVVFAAIVLVPGASLLFRGGLSWPTEWPDLPLQEWIVALLVVAGALLTMVARSRLAAICGLGVVGSGIALIFLKYSAPDVAMTQLLVEVLFVVIIAVVLLRLPAFRRTGPIGRVSRPLDAALSVAAGVVTTLLVFAATATPLDRTITRYFNETSVPEAQGGNIVNVILVDFRALDTLGEIIVVAVAGMAVYLLIKLRPKGGTTQ